MKINESYLLLMKQLTMYLKSLNLVCHGEMLYKTLKIVRFNVIDLKKKKDLKESYYSSVFLVSTSYSYHFHSTREYLL